MANNPPTLLWPSRMELPPETKKVIYLDLNHWIYLAQAAAGLARGRSYIKTLEACQAAISDRTAVFVLSASLYMEMSKIRDPSQRRDVAVIMEELTDFATIVCRVVVMELELGEVLDRLGTQADPLFVSKIPLVGKGVRHAFGLESGFKIFGPSGDETSRVRERMGADEFDVFARQMNLDLERSVLRGPADEEIDDLRTFGWKPDGLMRIAEARAAEEQAQSDRLDGDGPWRRSKLCDVIAARELIIEFRDILPRALEKRGLDLTDLFSDGGPGRAFVRAMPSTDISVSLKAAWHRNRDKSWTANDIFDIDALSLAVPYCDIVVTEKACHHVLVTENFGTRMHTAILRRLEDLPNAIIRWVPQRRPIT